MAERDIELARNRAADLLAQADADLSAGVIDEAGWYERVSTALSDAYLAAATPWEQSGKSGDAASFEYARSHLIDAVDRSGSFLDVGCASGYLMERLVAWGAAKGIVVEPHGLEISPRLAELARRRLPQWADRIYVGNAIDWMPPRRFDYVRTGLEYVPQRRQQDLVCHLLEHVVAPGGRLIVGTANELRERHEVAETLMSWGYALAGSSERAHRDPRLAYRVVWIDR